MPQPPLPPFLGGATAGAASPFAAYFLGVSPRSLGRDASRAFVTGDRSAAGLVDDVSDLSFSEMLTLQNWLSFYEKNYEFVGRVIGRFYGADGLPTPELTRVEAMVTQGAEAGRRALEEKQKFPPCNAEWSSSRGSRLWCSPERPAWTQMHLQPSVPFAAERNTDAPTHQPHGPPRRSPALPEKVEE
ncbi:neuferricin isoform X2 [Crocuta crocuta]